MSHGWDPAAYPEEMKRSTSPVSAFFLIDSVEAIDRCIEELGRLAPYGMPSLKDSGYFQRIGQIYESGREVLNVDHEVRLRWEGQEYPGLIRCHSVDPGRYEIELWLPGVIANAAKDLFKDGISGFYCAFMPPGYYD